MPETDYVVMDKVAANHAFRQTLLILLINHQAIGGKIRLAATVEFAERDFLFGATTQRMSYTNNGFRLWQRSGIGVCWIGKVVCHQLNFPYAISTVAAMLLQDPSLAGCQPQRQPL